MFDYFKGYWNIVSKTFSDLQNVLGYEIFNGKKKTEFFGFFL